MYCPKCSDEFRPGFTRCGRCNVDLVNELSGAEARPEAAPVGLPVRLAEYCGFFSLDEARYARDQLRQQRIRSDIVVREAPEADWNEPVREEYWLRVDVGRTREVATVLGEVPEEPAAQEEAKDDDSFECGACGKSVASDEVFCPNCGARFEE